jgi:hypothetical protein
VGAAELVNKLVSSPSVRACVTNQFFRLAYNRLESRADDCARQTLMSAIDKAGGSGAGAGTGGGMKATVLAIVRSDMFRHKRLD